MLQAQEAVVHSPVDPVALRSIRRAGFSAQYLPALFVLWRDLSAFWSARKKLDVLKRRELKSIPGGTHHFFSNSWDKRNFTVSLVGLLGPRSEFIVNWLRLIWVFRNGLSFFRLLGTKEVTVLKKRTDSL